MGRAINESIKDIEKEIDDLIILLNISENINHLLDRFKEIINNLNSLKELTEEEKLLIAEKMKVLSDLLKNKMDETIKIIDNKQKELEILNIAKKNLLEI